MPICYGYSLPKLKLLRQDCAKYYDFMFVRLPMRRVLRLRASKGIAIQVVRGAVWITEPKCSDQFLLKGETYRIAGNGLVLIESLAFGTPQDHSEIEIEEPAGYGWPLRRIVWRACLHFWPPT